MDKYIKMLLIKLSQRYKVTITTVMFCRKEDGRLISMHSLRISNPGQKRALCEYKTGDKRALVGEMMRWASPQSQ